MNIMKSRTVVITPKLEKILMEMGGQIKLARLRRGFSADQVCERAGISRTTLWQIEKGVQNVAIGAFAQVLFILNLEKDLLHIAREDEFGRMLQDAGLQTRKRAPKKSK